MISANWPFYIAAGILATSFALIISVFSSLSAKDSAQNDKLLTMIGGFSVVVGLTAFFMAWYFFNSNQTYITLFLLAMNLLVCLPATLFAISVSTVTISNLRDTLAAGAA
jgi:hypothetical protein